MPRGPLMRAYKGNGSLLPQKACPVVVVSCCQETLVFNPTIGADVRIFWKLFLLEEVNPTVLVGEQAEGTVALHAPQGEGEGDTGPLLFNIVEMLRVNP